MSETEELLDEPAELSVVEVTGADAVGHDVHLAYLADVAAVGVVGDAGHRL